MFAPQLIGIGGTGVNIIEALLRDKKTLFSLLNMEKMGISCLALDVANTDLPKLDKAYAELQDELRANSFAPSLVSLSANMVKFPNPEVMYNFVKEYPTYMGTDGRTIPKDYKPWITSVGQIPDTDGGVGRKRALAKAIYGLNYYVLNVIRDSIVSFRQHMVGINMPTHVFVIYGLGGGSGGGMALDFVSHLRKQLGRGVPIYGIGILPCSGDNPPAMGISAYCSILEHSLVLNHEINSKVTEKFGQYYENPFSAYFVVPLNPGWGENKGLLHAHASVDKAIIDILTHCLSFDLANLTAYVGCNVPLGNKWLHTLTTISLYYPVQDYIDLTNAYLKKMDKLGSLRKEKQEIYGGADENEPGGVKRLLDMNRLELEDLYRMILINQGKYDITKFDQAVKNLIYDDNLVENNFKQSIEDSFKTIKSQMEELYYSVDAVGLGAQEGTTISSIRKLLKELYDITIHIPDNLRKFDERSPEIIKDLPRLLASANRDLTQRQTQLIRDVISLVDYIQDFVAALHSHAEVAKLATKVEKFWKESDQTEQREKVLNDIKILTDTEMKALLTLISSMHCPLGTELREVDTYQSDCSRAKSAISLQENVAEEKCRNTEIQIAGVEAEKKRAEKELRKIWWLIGWLFPGNKKGLQREINGYNQQLAFLNEDLDKQKAELLRKQNKKKEYSSIEKKYEPNSDYRRLIFECVRMNNDYINKRNDLDKERGFYERNGKLTNKEQLQIMKMVLQGEERALNQEDILNDIVDRTNLNDVLKTVINNFRTPETLGLTSDYKTDYMWLTVVAPPGIWTTGLTRDAKTALAGYILSRQNVDAAITVQEIASGDPWKVRFLLFAAKATPSQLSTFQIMKGAYKDALDREMAHSYLLEYGIKVEDEDLTTFNNKLDSLS
jgi:hypothetical protein